VPGYRIDHIIYAARDIDVVTDRFATHYGLAAVPGGMHPTWGTANRIVPLGHEYLELVHVVDPEVAAANDFGRGILAAAEHGDRLAAWAVATDDLNADAARLGLEVTSGSRTRPDGSILRWHLAGVSDALRSGALPFFIAWHVPTELHPGAMAAPHRVQPDAITHLELLGDPGDIDAWLGPHDLPVTTRTGASSLAAVNIRTHAGTITIT
jgi:hypothetical protein